MKKLSLLFVLYVLTLTNANALDIEKLKKEALQKATAKEYVEIVDSHNTNIYEKTFRNKQYIFIHSEVEGHTQGYLHHEENHCVAIADADKWLNTFCMDGAHYIESRIDFKGDYFTIVFGINDFKYEVVWKSYYTFKFINDGFYLYQRSVEDFKRNGKDAQFESSGYDFDKTHIFYRQPRDDSKMTNLIPLESITDELIIELNDKCYKSGKCK